MKLGIKNKIALVTGGATGIGLAISKELANDRFNNWAKRLNTTPQNLNQQFINAMAKVCTPLAGAVDLIKALHEKENVNLAIITNGFESLQEYYS